MTALPNHKYTIEEYVELIKTTGEKMEYFDGEIFSMAGGKLAHGEIASNVQYALRSRLESRPCHTYNGEVAVKVPAAPPNRAKTRARHSAFQTGEWALGATRRYWAGE